MNQVFPSPRSSIFPATSASLKTLISQLLIAQGSGLCAELEGRLFSFRGFKSKTIKKIENTIQVKNTNRVNKQKAIQSLSEVVPMEIQQLYCF